MKITKHVLDEVIGDVIQETGARLELDEVRGWKDTSCPDCVYAIDILQAEGQEPGEPALLKRFSRELECRGRQARTKIAVEHEHPGIPIINQGPCWRPEDVEAISGAVEAASKRFNMDMVMDRLAVPVTPVPKF